MCNGGPFNCHGEITAVCQLCRFSLVFPYDNDKISHALFKALKYTVLGALPTAYSLFY